MTGLWPAAWLMGNLARTGYQKSTVVRNQYSTVKCSSVLYIGVQCSQQQFIQILYIFEWRNQTYDGYVASPRLSCFHCKIVYLIEQQLYLHLSSASLHLLRVLYRISSHILTVTHHVYLFVILESVAVELL